MSGAAAALIDPSVLRPALAGFLARQRWYAGDKPPRRVVVSGSHLERGGWPALLSVIVDADGARYHVPLGLRPADRPRGEGLHPRDEAVVGEVASDEGPLVAYDAPTDPALAMDLLDLVSARTESAARVRTMGGEQSNTSLVYDDRLILKLFRRLHPGSNPEVEVTQALHQVGFPYVAEPRGTWSRDDGEGHLDLAVLQRYLAGGTDGWALALTSLRDLFGVHDTQRVPVILPDAPPPASGPGEAGGDFSAEAGRLGTLTAELHLAMAEAFGRAPGSGETWAAAIEAQLARVRHPALDAGRAADVVERVRRVADPGPAIRVHGDYHLGQVMRTDEGWYVLDFEGEPARPLDERRRPSSPLRDVAGMLRSFQYAAASAARQRDDRGGREAAAWEDYNRSAFLSGYLRRARGTGLLPDQASLATILQGFELEKAVYEVGYEQAYRPDWIDIPLAAVRRLTEAGS